jgi:hypothetical protein
MDQGGRLQCVRAPLVAQIVSGEQVQLVIEPRSEGVEDSLALTADNRAASHEISAVLAASGCESA